MNSMPGSRAPAGACDITGLGTPITIDGGSLTVHARGVSGIDFQLDRGCNDIRAGSSMPIPSAPLAGSVEVFFFGMPATVVGHAVTDGLGEYQSQGGLPPGDYHAATVSGIGAASATITSTSSTTGRPACSTAT
jgi:hypothetical protein